MSKRTPGLPKRPNGFWPTPREAVAPLVPYLPARGWYGEPCAGDGALIRALDDLWPAGRLAWVSDIRPQEPIMAACLDALEIDASDARQVGLWITNPPWPEGGKRGDPALSIIAHLITIAPCWALLPWDFAANAYFNRLAAACTDIVPIGRVSWMGNGQPGKDNAAWYRFDAGNRRATAMWARGATENFPARAPVAITDPAMTTQRAPAIRVPANGGAA